MLKDFKIIEILPLLDPTTAIIISITILLIVLHYTGIIKFFLNKFSEKSKFQESVITKLGDNKDDIGKAIENTNSINNKIDQINEENKIINKKLDNISNNSNSDIVMRQLESIRKNLDKLEDISETDMKELRDKLYQLEKTLSNIKTILKMTNNKHSNVGSLDGIK